MKIFENAENENLSESTFTMSTLDEVYELDSRKENLEIIDDYSQNDQLAIELTFPYGTLKVTIPDEFPDETPIFEPAFKPVFDDGYIKFCLEDFCATRNGINLENLIDYIEKELLSELIDETPAEKLQLIKTGTECRGASTDSSGTEDSDNENSENEDSTGECMPPSELPEYQKRTDRHTGKRSKQGKQKSNGVFIQKEGLDEVWKTRRIEFHGKQTWWHGPRRDIMEYGTWYQHLLYSEIGDMTRSDDVQKRYGGQIDKLGGVQFRRENSKHDFDFIVRVHADSPRQNEKSKQFQDKFREYKRNEDAKWYVNNWPRFPWHYDVYTMPYKHVYILQYRADDPIFTGKTEFDQLVSEMDKAEVVKMENQIAKRKHDRKKFFRVHKKSHLIRTDLAHG